MKKFRPFKKRGNASLRRGYAPRYLYHLLKLIVFDLNFVLKADHHSLVGLNKRGFWEANNFHSHPHSETRCILPFLEF